MSAGNSADKPQFVENQMLTHDSLNNLVEFSAGRTQRVMKALGLGGSVSGVSWSWDKSSKQIIVKPGFIVFPDGEVAKIDVPQTFTSVDSNGILGKTSPPSIEKAPSQLQVSYDWAPKQNHKADKCFQAEAGLEQLNLVWRSTSDTDAFTDQRLPKPIITRWSDIVTTAGSSETVLTKPEFAKKIMGSFRSELQSLNTLISYISNLGLVNMSSVF